MKQLIHSLRSVLSKRKYLAIFIGFLAVLLPLLAISAAIISPYGFTTNPLAEPIGIVLTILIAILMSINLTVLLHNRDSKTLVKKKTTLLGGFAAFFTTACPVCQPTWLVWLGFGSAAGFLSDVSIYIAVASIGILIFSLYNSLKCADGKCEAGKNGKNN